MKPQGRGFINKKKMTEKTFLEDRKVILKPIMKPGGMNKTGHDGEFMYSGTEVHFVLPYNIKKGRLETILSPTEQKFFEELLGEDLSIHKKEDNFWHKFRIKIRKDDRLMKDGYQLDLNDPIDNLRWKVLKLSANVSPSWTARYDRGEYSFALADINELTENRARMADKRKKAYKFFGRIDTSKKKMRDFLRVYGKIASEGATLDFLNGAIDDLIENRSTIDRVLEIIDDDNYDMKLFIEDAVDCGAIKKETGRYYLQGGDAINKNNPTLEGTVEQMNIYKRDTDDIYLRMSTQIKNSKK